MIDPPTIDGAERPLRVLYCIDLIAAGGTEKQLIALISHLDRQRVLPFLCTLRPSALDVSRLECPAIQVGFASFGSLSVVSAVRRLRRFMVEQRIDIVHSFFQDSVILAFLATAGRPAPVRICSFRDMGFWRTRGKVLQLRQVYPRYQGFIANSRAVANRVHELDRIPLEKITVIYNGVEIPASVRAKDPSAPLTVGMVANLNRQVKRVDLFLRAARLVADAVPGVRFTIVGEGPLRPALSELASSLGLGQSVSFTGAVGDAALQIQSFDVGVLTSDSEGLPNVILEYMAAGIPTVARRVGGNAEVIRDGETGLLVDSQGPSTIAEAILRLVSDPELRQQMGARARGLASTEFSFDACVRHHEDYYWTMRDVVRDPNKTLKRTRNRLT